MYLILCLIPTASKITVLVNDESQVQKWFTFEDIIGSERPSVFRAESEILLARSSTLFGMLTLFEQAAFAFFFAKFISRLYTNRSAKFSWLLPHVQISSTLFWRNILPLIGYNPRVLFKATNYERLIQIQEVKYWEIIHSTVGINPITEEPPSRAMIHISIKQQETW